MAGINGFGVTLGRGDGTGPPEVFTEIANISSLTPPTESRETSDVTAHDSPGGWREFIGTLKDGGSVSMELNFDPAVATHLTLRDDFDDTATRTYQIIFPDTGATQIDFEAILTGFAAVSPLDGKMTASVTFKVSGEPVWS